MPDNPYEAPKERYAYPLVPRLILGAVAIALAFAFAWCFSGSL